MAQEGGAQARQNRGLGLDRFHLRSGNLGDWHQTGADRTAIDQNGASAAIPGIAAHLGTALAKVFAKRFAETQGRWGIHRDRPTVEGEGDHASPRSRR